MAPRLLPATLVGVFVTLVTVALVGLNAPAADEKTRSSKESHSAFGTTNVWSIHIEISAKEFDAMQPAIAGFGGPGGPPPPKPKKDARDSERNLFGTEFPWADSDVTIDGKQVKKAGIRYAGD